MSVGRSPAAPVGLGCMVLLLAATPPAATAETPKWNDLERSVGKENYADAKKQADAILQRGTGEDRQKTTAVYGRILLGLGQKEQARQYIS